MKFATVDVGTNTALLLIVEVGGGGAMKVIGRGRRVVRLGEGVDESGMVKEEAMRRLGEALQAFQRKAREEGADIVSVCGTSASRDARNKSELVRFVRDHTGLEYTILSGEAEAYWSFRAATSVFDNPPPLCAVLDIGGGSTELIVGQPGTGDGELRARHSFNIGTVRLTERLFPTQPPPRASFAKAIETIDAILGDEGQNLKNAFSEPLPLVGVAGTMVALSFLVNDVETWADVPSIPLPIPIAAVSRLRKELFSLSFEEVTALNPAVMNGRADVFPMGVLIVERILHHFPVRSLAMSSRGLQYGLVLRHLEGLGLTP